MANYFAATDNPTNLTKLPRDSAGDTIRADIVMSEREPNVLHSVSTMEVGAASRKGIVRQGNTATSSVTLTNVTSINGPRVLPLEIAWKRAAVEE